MRSVVAEAFINQKYFAILVTTLPPHILLTSTFFRILFESLSQSSYKVQTFIAKTKNSKFHAGQCRHYLFVCILRTCQKYQNFSLVSNVINQISSPCNHISMRTGYNFFFFYKYFSMEIVMLYTQLCVKTYLFIRLLCLLFKTTAKMSSLPCELHGSPACYQLIKMHKKDDCQSRAYL